ncbi:MAG: nucleotidyl transferase AbiEii/AbiGii toxin family protein [bacterium]|jgi:hypothetical protein|nr:nucleotidyl transferase AbiEii/AbiGii toxin family protein [bacterium]
MSKRKPVNIAASVKQRLLNVSRNRGEDFNFVLTRYCLERFLYRLAVSNFQDRFILKGALLFSAWLDQPHRPTRDIDLAGHGDSSTEYLTTFFQEICQVTSPDDGVTFDPGSVEVTEIREEQTYGGQRVTIIAHLGQARTTVRVDVGYGDAITPGAVETTIAEKLEAMVSLGMLNSRMKDFFDLWTMSTRLSFEGPVLVKAIRRTFERRSTNLPDEIPIALSESFYSNKDKMMQWNAFVKRIRAIEQTPSLSELIQNLSLFLWSPLRSASANKTFEKTWNPGGPWSP